MGAGLGVLTNQVAFRQYVEQGKDKLCLKPDPEANAASEEFHLSFAAPSQEAVDEFHRAALKHGARDNGQPALREYYGPSYYSAFVIDVGGHRLEAVHK
jgi:predicted lactoylglutathione lyase